MEEDVVEPEDQDEAEDPVDAQAVWDGLKDERDQVAELPVEMAYEDLQALASELSELVVKLGSLEDEKAAVMKELAAEIKTLRKQQDKLAHEWHSRKRVQRMMVTVRFDWAAGEKWYRSPATGQIWGPYPITDEDRQTTMKDAPSQPSGQRSLLLTGQQDGVAEEEVQEGEVVDEEVFFCDGCHLPVLADDAKTVKGQVFCFDCAQKATA